MPGMRPMSQTLSAAIAELRGPEQTPYEEGTFKLEITVPDRYPFEPPRVKFATPVYHPNIDTGGRICLDTLKMQPQVRLNLQTCAVRT